MERHQERDVWWPKESTGELGQGSGRPPTALGRQGTRETMGRGSGDVGRKWVGKGPMVHQVPKLIPTFLSDSQVPMHTSDGTQWSWEGPLSFLCHQLLVVYKRSPNSATCFWTGELLKPKKKGRGTHCTSCFERLSGRGKPVLPYPGQSAYQSICSRLSWINTTTS